MSSCCVDRQFPPLSSFVLLSSNVEFVHCVYSGSHETALKRTWESHGSPDDIGHLFPMTQCLWPQRGTLSSHSSPDSVFYHLDAQTLLFSLQSYSGGVESYHSPGPKQWTPVSLCHGTCLVGTSSTTASTWVCCAMFAQSSPHYYAELFFFFHSLIPKKVWLDFELETSLWPVVIFPYLFLLVLLNLFFMYCF